MADSWWLMARVDLAGVVGRYHNGGMIVPHRVSGNANQGGTAGAIGELGSRP